MPNPINIIELLLYYKTPLDITKYYCRTALYY